MDDINYKDLLKFVPAEFSVLDAAFGDLNLDSHRDAIVILKYKREDTLYGPKRPLLIIIGKGGNKFELAERNDDVVLCSECGGVYGDPYTGVTIKNGYFSVEHYGGSAWRWTRIITFKYSQTNKTWLLHKDGGEYYHTSDPDKATNTVQTVKDFGTVLFKNYNYEDFTK